MELKPPSTAIACVRKLAQPRHCQAAFARARDQKMVGNTETVAGFGCGANLCSQLGSQGCRYRGMPKLDA